MPNKNIIPFKRIQNIDVIMGMPCIVKAETVRAIIFYRGNAEHTIPAHTKINVDMEDLVAEYLDMNILLELQDFRILNSH